MVKRTNERIICVLVIALLLCCCGAIMINQSIAYADNLSETRDIDEICRIYTDSISPNGIDFNVYLSAFENEKYPRYTCDVATTVGKVVLPQNELYGNNVQYSGSHSRVDAEVDGDDNIVKLIPRELFTYANKTLFVGKKYGFLVVTNCSSSGFFTSTVIMIEVVGDMSDYLADITLKVRNTLEYAYVTVNQTSTTLPYMDSLSTSGIIVSYTLNNELTSAVVPLPGIKNGGSAKYLCYFESNRYMLANISFGAKICSQNKYNQWDSQYEASGDTGYFFTGNNYYYSASKHSDSGFYDGITEVTKGVISAGIDKVISIAEDVASNAVMPFDIA